jgi:hypothetical protein
LADEVLAECWAVYVVEAARAGFAYSGFDSVVALLPLVTVDAQEWVVAAEGCFGVLLADRADLPVGVSLKDCVADEFEFARGVVALGVNLYVYVVSGVVLPKHYDWTCK